MQTLDKLKKYWFYSFLASMTLGLAPFTPAPHLWGKLRWIWGGAEGMALMDWGDLFMHGFPWLCLLFFSIKYSTYKSSDRYQKDLANFKSMVNNKTTYIIDVREKNEFTTGHFPGAINIPLSNISNRIADFKNMKGEKILYCRSGQRSGSAIKFLQKKGISQLHNGGGLSKMKELVN